ncbi:MAG TPA: D-alanine--D-alanine ligase [Lacipirellulaceae bacterium]|nr:D-alanine--D-alanine ligase [Lacipirellulaceae bacterium]
MDIGLTYDLRTDYLAAGYTEEETAEFDQLATIEALEAALRQLGHTTDRIGHARNLIDRLASGEHWDLVFNICEGLRGIAREAQVPAILDVYEIPYTFADPATLCLCLDKALTKTVLRAAGIPTPEWHVVRSMEDVASCKVAFPAIAKPIAEGTGKGIDASSKIIDAVSLSNACQRLLERFQQPVLIEQFLPGREFTVGVTGNRHKAQAIGSLEIVLRSNAEQHVYSYVNKENSEQLVDCNPVRAASDVLVAEAEAIAIAAWQAVGGRDAGRVDLRCDAAGRPQVMEINPLAGLHPTHSDLPMLWKARGRKYLELIGRIVNEASSRVTEREPSAGAASQLTAH